MIQPTLPLVVYQRKETTTSAINTLAQSTPVLVKIKESENDKGEIVGEQKCEIEKTKGTQVQTGHLDTPTPTTQKQGAFVNMEKEKDETKELGMNTKLEEKIAIQTLVTL